VHRLSRSSVQNWLLELSRFAITKPSQLREKSDQWFNEVEFLHEHERWSPLIYLGGFVIECLLKSVLWTRRAEPRAAQLVGRSHDLGQLLAECAALDAEIRKPAFAQVRSAFEFLASWTVRIRYNPKRPSAADARMYWQRLVEVRRWLLGRT
jgi:hypothetical protein